MCGRGNMIYLMCLWCCRFQISALFRLNMCVALCWFNTCFCHVVPIKALNLNLHFVFVQYCSLLLNGGTSFNETWHSTGKETYFPKACQCFQYQTTLFGFGEYGPYNYCKLLLFSNTSRSPQCRFYVPENCLIIALDTGLAPIRSHPIHIKTWNSVGLEATSSALIWNIVVWYDQISPAGGCSTHIMTTVTRYNEVPSPVPWIIIVTKVLPESSNGIQVLWSVVFPFSCRLQFGHHEPSVTYVDWDTVSFKRKRPGHYLSHCLNQYLLGPLT